MCLEPECPNMAVNGVRCVAHDREWERARGKQRAAYRDPTYRATRAALLAYGKCADCGSCEDLTVDHVIPLVKGGTNAPINLRVLCRRCNSQKGTTEYRAGEQEQEIR